MPKFIRIAQHGAEFKQQKWKETEEDTASAFVPNKAQETNCSRTKKMIATQFVKIRCEAHKCVSCTMPTN